MSPARAIAARVLERVWGDDAFAAAALDAELARHASLDPRDVGLATELVYGVLRTEAALVQRLEALAPRGLALKGAARAHVLIGAYTVSFLDRVPPFAAVSEAVAGVRATGDPRGGGFANAVLRRLVDSVGAARPDLTSAVAASAPGWLRGALRRAVGRAGATAYLGAGPVPPPIGLALARGEDRASWLQRLAEAAPSAEIAPGSVSPRAILVRGAGDVRRLPGAGRAWIVQEEGSQLVALGLGAREGERVLDACAGRGNKSWVLLGEVGPGGAVDAADLHPPKLAVLRAQAPDVRATAAVDWTTRAGAEALPGAYDRVLVDAPCSGTGTLRRRPEIARHRSAEDVRRLALLQEAVVRGAAPLVREGGRLTFSVCSVLREETDQVVARLIERPIRLPDGTPLALAPAPFDAPAVRELAGDASSLRLLPHVHGTDGYFLASFEVRRGA